MSFLLCYFSIKAFRSPVLWNNWAITCSSGSVALFLFICPLKTCLYPLHASAGFEFSGFLSLSHLSPEPSLLHILNPINSSRFQPASKMSDLRERKREDRWTNDRNEAEVESGRWISEEREGRVKEKKQAVRLEQTKDDLQKTFNVFKDRQQVKCPLV